MNYLLKLVFALMVVTALIVYVSKGFSEEQVSPVHVVEPWDASIETPRERSREESGSLSSPGDSSTSERTLVPQATSSEFSLTIREVGVECPELLAERDRLVEEVAHLQLQLEKTRYPEDSAYGMFLESHEAEGTSQQERNAVREALEEVPVMVLHAGEAAWIMERQQEKDWKVYAETRSEALIRFLGPQRVLAEATPLGVEKLKFWYDSEEWLQLFGTQRPQD